MPIVFNNATTGHKLQGSSVDQLFIHEWKYGCRNWVYVVLSRVRTRNGLFIRKPIKISEIKNFNTVPDALTKMLDKFRQYSPEMFSSRVYEGLKVDLGQP